MSSTKQIDPNMKESRQLKVTLKATAAHPFYKDGYIFKVHPSQQPKLIDNGWAVGENESTETAKPAKAPKAAPKAQ